MILGLKGLMHIFLFGNVVNYKESTFDVCEDATTCLYLFFCYFLERSAEEKERIFWKSFFLPEAPANRAMNSTILFIFRLFSFLSFVCNVFRETCLLFEASPRQALNGIIYFIF